MKLNPLLQLNIAKKKFNQPTHQSHQPRKKKAFGQHFLHKQSVVDHMIEKVTIAPQTSVLEIGCGEGFLTQAILAQTPCKQLWSFEIDPEWAEVVQKKIADPRLSIKLQNFLETDFEQFKPHVQWVILANLPYQITFPIIFLFQKHKELFKEGVIMVQEEVAQKIVAASGRSFNATSLFLQHHFTWELMEKIEPEAFNPPPKVHSRLLHFKPRHDAQPIRDEEGFWHFVRLCFKSPRQTLRNNLRTTHFDVACIAPETLNLRAQQMNFDQFVDTWKRFDH